MVLIILAAVSISMLTGENGIITQAQNAKDATEQARVEELVDLAVNSLMGKNTGNINTFLELMEVETVEKEIASNTLNNSNNEKDLYGNNKDEGNNTFRK